MLEAEHSNYLHCINEALEFTAYVKTTQFPKNRYLTAS